MADNHSREQADHDSARHAEQRSADYLNSATGLTDQQPLALPGSPTDLLAHPNINTRGNGALRNAAVQRMQHTQGNRATTRFLQRSSQSAAPMPGDDIGQRIEARAGAGNSLDVDVQRQLEQGLGADLSSVRVHTDGEADHLARSVESVAFTTGNDIFFRSGAYNPGSSDGLHLLAHEASHTVQQGAGPVAGTPTAGGVSVSDPSDSFEQAADHAADSVVAGNVAPTVAAPAHTPAQRAVQRSTVNDALAKKQWGAPGFSNVDFVQWADVIVDNGPGSVYQLLNSGDAQNAAASVQPGNTGRIVIHQNIWWWYNDQKKINQGGVGNTTTDITFQVGDDGKVNFGSAALTHSGGAPGFLSFNHTSAPAPGDKTGSVVHSVEIVNAVSTQDSTSTTDTKGHEHSDGTGWTFGTNAGGGGEVGTGAAPGGKVSGNAGLSAGKSGSTNDSDSNSHATTTGTATTGSGDYRSVLPLRITLNVPPRAKKSTTVHFGVGSADVGAVYAALHGWYAGLSRDDKDLAATHKLKITLSGHASVTGGFAVNEPLAGRRIQAVMGALINASSGQLKQDDFFKDNQASHDAEAQGKTKEAEEDRRVDVEF